MNCAEAVKRFADWADRAGRVDMPIKVSATRRTLMSEASRTGIGIATRVRGGALFIGAHEVIPLKDEQKTNQKQLEATQ